MHRLVLNSFTTRNLKSLDLVVESGECVVLWGPSGSGKTRLLRAIADLDPHQGEAWCGTVQRSQTDSPAWRRKVGYLPAESHWWTDRVGDHFPLDAEVELALLGMPQQALDWQVERVSSGERQRLALLRMLAHRPQVLLLDEATANLDQENILRMEELINAYREQHQAAVLWVSHDERQHRRIAKRGYVIVGDGLEEKRWI